MIKDYKFYKEDYQDQIKIKFLNEDWINDIRQAAMETIGKNIVNDKPMTSDLLFKYLISEHSPIRNTLLNIRLTNIYYPTSVHFVRHGMTTHYVETSRTDRKQIERSLTVPTNHTFNMNLQNLIDMARKRLCIGCVAKDTFNWMKSIKLKFNNSNDVYLEVIGQALVPNCIYRWGCPEFKTCGLVYKFDVDNESYESDVIRERYQVFNQWFYQNYNTDHNAD
jgi:hypothetical protein